MHLFTQARFGSASMTYGIGEKLMHWLAGYALEHGCARFDWTVDEANLGALRFYTELGSTHVKDKLYFRFSGESLEALAAGGKRGT
ncbi:GNAT family N-acetyltransferase [Aeromonas dhakensis]|uniref:GNAT family N-acetyltransferase n=1 Tax=Aeromonas TaxID=642 RepID=UPI00366D6332